MNKIFKFIKTFSIYFLGTILTKLITFILLPLYSNKLSTDQFGYYDYTITILTIVVGVVCIEVWTGAIRFLLLREEKEEKARVVCSSIVLVGASLAILVIVFFVLRYMFDIPYLNYIALYSIFYLFQSLYAAFIRGYQRNKDFVISGLLSSLTNFLINVYFIGFKNCGLEFLYLAFAAGALVQIVYIETRIHTMSSVRRKYWDSLLFKRLFFFCLPLFINSISYWVLTSYSKVIIINQLGSSANGIYSMGLRFASAITLVTSVLSLAWQEMVFSEKEDQKLLYTNGLTMYYHLIIYALIIVLPILKYAYPLLINDKYIAAMTILPICLLNTLVNAYADFTGKIIIAENQTKLIFVSSVCGAAACVLLAQGLVGRTGIIGVVTAIFVGFLLSILLRIIWLLYAFKGQVVVKDILIPAVQLIVTVVLYYVCDGAMYIIASVLLAGWILLRSKGNIALFVKMMKEKSGKNI